MSILSIDVPPGAAIWGTVLPEQLSYTADWWDGGSKNDWNHSGVLEVPLQAPALQAAAASLAPAFYRIGGSKADTVIFDWQILEGDEAAASVCALWNSRTVHDTKCLTKERYTELLDFTVAAGARLVFCLNYIRTSWDDTREWESDQARAFLTYTQEYAVAHGVPNLLYGVELGNEATHNGKISDLDRYRRGFQTLRALVTELYPENGSSDRPLIIGPSSAGSAAYAELVPIVGESVDVVAYHVYHRNGKDSNMMEEAALKSWYEGPYKWSARAAVVETAPQPNHIQQLWVGEGAMASQSGREGITDTFLSSLWFADMLASQAKSQPLSHSVFCRQALTGGHYGLLLVHDPAGELITTRPDFWLMRTWRAIGVGVHAVGPLQSNRGGDQLDSQHTWNYQNLLGHAFCHKDMTGDVVLILINFGNDDYTIQVPATGTNRSEYILTGRSALDTSVSAVNGERVSVNGQLQDLTADGTLSVLEAVSKLPSDTTLVPSHSVSFLVLHDTKVGVCIDSGRSGNGGSTSSSHLLLAACGMAVVVAIASMVFRKRLLLLGGHYGLLGHVDEEDGMQLSRVEYHDGDDDGEEENENETEAYESEPQFTIDEEDEESEEDVDGVVL